MPVNDQERGNGAARVLDAYRSEIDLAAFARERYGYHLQEWQSTGGIHVLKNMLSQHTIVVARDADTRHWVYSTLEPEVGSTAPLQQERGTIVDFVQHRSREQSLDVVHHECESWTARGVAPTNSRPHREAAPRAGAKSLTPSAATLAAQYAAAKAKDACLCLAKCGVRPDTQAHPRFRDTWRVDERGRVLFPHHDANGVQGFETRGEFIKSGFEGEGRLWHSRLHKDDLVLVCTESALKALSYHQVHQRADARYLSTAGPVMKAQVELLTQAAAKLPSNGVVVLAFDNDQFGDELAVVVSQALADKGVRVCRHAPPQPERFTSWNDVVREREHSFIQGLYPRREVRSPKPSPRGPELTR